MDKKEETAFGRSFSPEQPPASDKNETRPVWHCSTYCRKVRHIYCEGQAYVKEDAPGLCPYFDEMLY